ncbi:nicotinate-nucleotide adenylyltransferase [Lacinutrix gracilariae]|uniref:Nicotinate-nucleotide adenylyltransferase n=1 Tax=Lacinutrix gracilariae TaxID=1747198 RepID=A0ABW5K0J2_9FLAO
MKKVIIGLLFFGLTIQLYAQDPAPTMLDEVVLVNTNYKYISSTEGRDLAVPVEQLELKVANFDVKTLDFYTDEYEFYDVYFFIPEGKILATYDGKGTILRTAEKYKGIDLPKAVVHAVSKRFPEWEITKDLYLVNYFESGNSTKRYKLTLTNGDKRIKVKLDDAGNFL